MGRQSAVRPPRHRPLDADLRLPVITLGVGTIADAGRIVVVATPDDRLVASADRIIRLDAHPSPSDGAASTGALAHDETLVGA